MKNRWGVILAAVWLGCGDGPSEGGFCGKLGAAPGCGGEAAICGERAEAARRSTTCSQTLDALLACLAGTELSCEGGSDFTVRSSSGSGATTTPREFFGNYRLELSVPWVEHASVPAAVTTPIAP